MKKYIITSLLVLASFGISSAEVIGDVDTSASEVPCTELSYNLKLRSKDATTNGEVMALQEFLVSVGLLDAEPNGYFGNGTLKAVKAFQKQNGFTASGLVGPLTRKAIKAKSCAQKSAATVPTISTEIPTAIMCTMEYRACADGSAMPRDTNCTWREDKCPTTTVDTSLGEYVGYMNDVVFIKTASITKTEAYNNCKNNALTNPTATIRCTWKGLELYSVKGVSVATTTTANTVSAIDFTLSPVDTCIDPPTDGNDIYLTLRSAMPAGSMVYMGEDATYSTGRFGRGLDGLSSVKLPIGLSVAGTDASLGLEPERTYYVSVYNGATKTTSASKTITLPMCQKSEVLGAYMDASTMHDTPSSCVDIGVNLHRGKETSTVKKLQSFLYEKGFLLEKPTGFYGDATIDAVMMYQGSRGIKESGMVYEATRQMIKTESCGN